MLVVLACGVLGGSDDCMVIAQCNTVSVSSVERLTAVLQCLRFSGNGNVQE